MVLHEPIFWEDWVVDDVKRTRRHLPHWTRNGASYFITFRLREGEMNRDERAIVLKHLLSGDGKFYELSAAVVMPDHAHAILQPAKGFDLSRIMHGIKGVSARLLNQARGKSGAVWQDETFDRIIRDEQEFHYKLKYMLDNPFRKGLAADGWEWDAWYCK